LIQSAASPPLEDSIQRWAFRLGLGGLIPFIGLAALAWLAPDTLGGLVPEMQVMYAVVILTFIGAIHWGIGLASLQAAQPERVGEQRIALSMVWSVLPSLYCWVVALLPPIQALPLLTAGLLIAWLVDRVLYARYSTPAWFMRLRTLLSFGAGTGLLATWAALLVAGL
jgi:hypothetical protein